MQPEHDTLPFHLLTKDGTVYRDVPLDREHAALAGRYWHAVDQALLGRVADLQSFRSITISDIHGRTYHLLTDVNAIRVWLDRMSAPERRDWAATLHNDAGRGWQ